MGGNSPALILRKISAGSLKEVDVMKAVKGKEIFLATENKVGVLAEAAQLLKDKNINIRAISAYAVEDKAFFRVIASDNTQAAEALKSMGSVEEKEVVIVDMPDEVGQLSDLSSKLKAANTDLIYIYGTTSQPGKSAIIIFSSDNNDKALEAVSV